MTRALAILIFLTFSSSAWADELVSGLSTDLIKINSSFTGTEFVLFGAIEASDDEPRDVVVVIRGPDQEFTVRRKERILGIWLNRQQIAFRGMPGYYFLASTRTLDDITSLSTLQRFRLGTANLAASVPEDADRNEADAFRAAAIRAKKRERLYWESPTGIEFLSPTLFRARVPVPASVPPGQYRAEVYLFNNGSVASAQSSPLFIDKTGLERQVYNLAYRDSLLYGVMAVLMAFTMGALGFFLFRQRA